MNKMEYEIVNGSPVKMTPERINLHQNGYHKVHRDILEIKEAVPLFKKIKLEGAVNVEITPKEYTDQRIDTLEKSINQRFDSNEKLVTEKLNHLHSRFEGTLETKLNALKESISAEQKTQTQNNKTNLLTIISIATAIIIGVISIGVTIAIAMLS